MNDNHEQRDNSLKNRKGQGGNKLMNHDKIDETLQAFHQMRFTGNIIPHGWYKKITFESGRADLLSCVILSDIVYWYRPIEIRDEQTGALIALKKKFNADMLQRTIHSLSKKFGSSPRQVAASLKRLEAKGLITKECRNIQTEHYKVGNALFLAPVVSKIAELQDEPQRGFPNEGDADYLIPIKKTMIPHEVSPQCHPNDKGVQSNAAPHTTECTPSYIQMYKGVQSNVVPHTFEWCTYTEITTETSTEISKKLTTTENPTADDNSKREVQPESAVVRSVGFLNKSSEKNNPTQTPQLTTTAVKPVEPEPVSNDSAVTASIADSALPQQHVPPTARIEDGRIGETLTPTQLSRITQAVDKLTAERIISSPLQIAAEVKFALLDPSILDRSHFSFSRKLNAIVRLIQGNRWTTPSGMSVQPTQVDRNSGQQGQPLDSINPQSSCPEQAALKAIEFQIKKYHDEINGEQHILNLIDGKEDPFSIQDRARREANINRFEAEISTLCEKRKRLLESKQDNGRFSLAQGPPQAMTG